MSVSEGERHMLCQHGSAEGPYKIRDDEVSFWHLCLGLGGGECPVLGHVCSAVPCELTLLSSPLSLPTLGWTHETSTILEDA